MNYKIKNGIKYYLPGDVHVGSSGFTNYMGNDPTPDEVWADFPKAIIVDGNDDWYAKPETRPAKLVSDWEIQPLAWFHTGISGISNSGAVLNPNDYKKFSARYEREFGVRPELKIRVYRPA